MAQVHPEGAGQAESRLSSRDRLTSGWIQADAAC